MASEPCSRPSAAATAGRGPRSAAVASSNKKLTCLCSPTSHPGSFRCSRHRNGAAAPGGAEAAPTSAGSGSRARRAAKGRSVRALLLQRIGGGPGERRRRCADFQPRPSRLRIMNM